MSASVRAVYHHNDLDSTAAAYIIGIYIKNWIRRSVIYHGFGCIGPIVPWFAVGFVMVEMFFLVCDA